MGTTKVAFTIESELLKQLDELVAKKLFKNRSRAIQLAIEEKLMRLNNNRLARECNKLDPEFEQWLAMGLMNKGEVTWEEY